MQQFELDDLEEWYKKSLVLLEANFIKALPINELLNSNFG